MGEEQIPSDAQQPDRVGELTVLIEQAQGGRDDAQRELFAQVYNELRVIANAYMRAERPRAYARCDSVGE